MLGDDQYGVPVRGCYALSKRHLVRRSESGHRRSAKGSGNNLTLPAALGLTPPVIAQLSNDAVCWTAEYAAADVIANRATVFGARN